MAWREGEQVGPYLLESQLGQGGMATVYKAYHQQLDRYVAIKVMHQNFLDDDTFVARFKREAQIVARLEHPHIVPVYDFEEHAGQPYLVMKYVQGQTLKQKLIKKPLTLEEILHVMTAVGGALTYAHKHNVLHRDIKPSNIVIDTDNVPYLADFGLARLASSGESTMSADMLLGTPHYISPEQARGDKDLDGRADIYSLGVVLYELLVGHVPYTGDTPYSIIHDHIYTPLPEPTKINPEIPLSVEAVLYKALEKNREDRYETANEMVDDLRFAIDEANLTELDPSRADSAAASLAKVREEMGEAVRTPTGISGPMPTQTATPSTFRTAMLKKKPTRWYQDERIWPASGCATLLIICFLSCGILLNMSTNIQELMALSASGAFNAQNADEGVPPELLPLGIELDTSNGYTIFVAPDRPLEMVNALQEQFPEEALVYLSLAHNHWQNKDPDAAQQAITGGAAFTDNMPQYAASAAFAAQSAEDTNAALIYTIIALESARSDVETFEQLRPASGEFIYETAATVDFSEEVGNLSIGPNINLDESPVALFAVVRNRIAHGNDRLAAAMLRRADNADVLQPEFMLLQAELDILRDNPADAIAKLNAILEGDAPAWVTGRANDLLDELAP